MELEVEYFNVIGSILKCLGDIALIMLPYWLLPPKWRWSALLPLSLMSLWCVGNLAYFRFWNDMIPPASISMGGNVDGNLMEYGIALLKWSDLMFVLTPCLAWIVLRRVRPCMSPSFDTSEKLIMVVVSVVVGCLGQVSYLKTSYSWHSEIGNRDAAEVVYDHFVGPYVPDDIVYSSQRQLYVRNGLVYYVGRFITEMFEVLTSSIDLTGEQRDEIAEFLKEYQHATLSPDTIVSRDSMNVVYIIVESLNSDVVGRRIAGTSVMPVLDSLARMDGTVVFDNVVSQIKASSSSDGHLLLMTGLLPPEKVAYSISYGSHNKFPSLADALPNHHKYLLLADDGVCWNEGNTLRNFGLGEPLALQDRPAYDAKVYGRDGAMFMQTIDILKSGMVKEPFFMTLMTISMHIPFIEEAWPLPADLDSAIGLSNMEKNYVNMCRNTDRYIGDFLKALPQNTLVIIASDHHQSIASDGIEEQKAFYMAVNTGRTERISRTVGQVNLFPATLDILGKRMAYGGLAPSAFNPCVDGTIDSYGNKYGNLSFETLDTLTRAYRLSDLIIRGDYFKEDSLLSKGL